MSTVEGITLEKSLEGFVASHKKILYVKNQGLLIRSDDEFKRDQKSVVLISGGGSGHEPFPVGFVGNGMLSTAVCGQIFTSPSVTSILASILLTAPNPNREILMIINNYTGDRLNFGLAIETARNVYKYRNIKAITIDDDCAIDNPRNSTGRRGLSGINLVIKIAGSMSARGHSVTEIYERCSPLLRDRLIRSIGFSFHHHVSNELNGIEIGYGIHGEPGVIKIERSPNFMPIIDVMIKKLKVDEIKSDVVLLFNNLGGASEFIFYHFIGDFLRVLRNYQLKVIKVYGGKFLTSLSKEGIGVTMMEIKDKSLIDFLDDPINVPAKELFTQLEISSCDAINFDIPSRKSGKDDISGYSDPIIAKILTDICSTIIESKQLLNEMDSELGDGDTGSTLSRGAESIIKELPKLNIAEPHVLLTSLSDVLMNSMGGTAGAIFSIFLQCASNAFVDVNKHSIANWIRALSMGIEGIMEHGKAEIGDRTLVDSLNSGCDAMKEIKSGKVLEALSAFANGCEKGTQATKKMKPKSGRASYSVSEGEEFHSKYPDPGSYAISLISMAIFKSLSVLPD